MTYIPHRHSIKSVIRFIPAIRTLLDQHQRNGVASVSFNPLELNLSVETSIARLRDAVQSLTSGLTSHPSIDSEALKLIWPLYKVSSDGTNVQILPRETKLVEPITQVQTRLAELVSDEAGFVEELTAFAVLLGRRRLQGQVDIIGDLSESLQHRIMSENDVVFISDGQQKHHMI
jgi:hypothetical protein